ncbi:hypothetical protein J7F03_18515 [Streptomyces sp. ISL-43]|uniref:hypothetical protein n=1 Tax=Streptomyces sp. ISL-43 TaxID=2819183 RepID=UPI001BECF7DD|nr:hypothetical protein [Streptomyces sp. ISL-43]MBT2449052.1 hypothetical protein [Streptomyces sp. ISL-43]
MSDSPGTSRSLFGRLLGGGSRAGFGGLGGTPDGGRRTTLPRRREDRDDVFHADHHG